MDTAAAKAFILARLQEPSTWRGLILIVTALGANVKPELGEAIVTAGLMLAGLVAVAFPDRRTPGAPKPPDDGQDSGV